MKEASNEEDDARSREISLFAALARGDVAPAATPERPTRLAVEESTGDDAPTVSLVGPSDPFPSFDNKKRAGREQRNRSRNNSGIPSSLELDTLTNQTGTFQYTPVSSLKTSETSHLEAAAESLGASAATKSKDNALPKASINTKNQGWEGNALATPSEADKSADGTTPYLDAPMFIEEVVMSRPLFFGPILPPRVIHEGRALIAPHVHMPLSRMPPSVRNFVGAVRTYGFGLEKLLFMNNEEFDQYCEENPEYWRGDPTVSVFSPVNDEAKRVEQINQMKQRSRPTHMPRTSIVRSLTAPSRLGQRHADDDRPGESLPDMESFWRTPTEGDSLLVLDGISTTETAHQDAETSPTTLDRSQRFASPFDGGRHEMTETEQFAMWANGGGMESIAMGPDVGTDAGRKTIFDTFQKLPSSRDSDAAEHFDDSDSVVDDELKKQVGLNECLSKAIASLTEEYSDLAPMDSFANSTSRDILNGAIRSRSRKRPLSNYELTNGCAPLFGADDDALPAESDLGVHHTRESQQRSMEQKRSYDIVEKYVPPNIFGSVACPSTALGPDDYHSWKSRSSLSPASYRFSRAPSDSSSRTSRSLPADTASTGSRSIPSVRASKHVRNYGKKNAFGWWHLQNDDSIPADYLSEAETSDSLEAHGSRFHLPPLHHAAMTPHVATPLEPRPQDLLENNMPLSKLHAATPLARCLPYISDRPPSYRYLQVEAQSVGFPPIGGEIEPLFCSIAIYHIEAVSDSAKLDNSSAPMPNLQRCGRVTEILNFDVVNEEKTLHNCRSAIWPYSHSLENCVDESLCCRCGLFPLPTNLNIANLYIVIVVKKVFSEVNGFTVYLEPTKNPSELERVRTQAIKDANAYGPFLAPFAFGVAPLYQVFGPEDPAIPLSRAVQIPLFEFQGDERTIVEHVMALLYPRAITTESKASLTNGGTAMLVMRNYGLLGLHKVVDDRSSLARDCLIDFTGDLQLRRKFPAECANPAASVGEHDTSNDHQGIYRAYHPDWHPSIIAEPVSLRERSVSSMNSPDKSRGFAREMAVVPLHLNPISRLPTTSNMHDGPPSRLNGNDIEPACLASFCNELLFHPRIVHNCYSNNIIIKAELRQVQWQPEQRLFLAKRARGGPRIHNNRRGPYLVDSVFTSCSRACSEHFFMDEFKLKLPYILSASDDQDSTSQLSLLFTAFRMKTEIPGQNFNDREKLSLDDEIWSADNSCLSQVACGFLPLVSGTCLITDGLHDVRMAYTARTPTSTLGAATDDEHDLILVTQQIGSLAEDENHLEMTAASGVQISVPEPLSLSVRIVAHSSLHSQSETMSTLLQYETNISPGAAVFDSRKISEEAEDRLCRLVTDLTQQSLCEISQSSRYLWRLLSVLWRMVILGEGEQDAVWANPSASTELRIHAFASIMNLLASTTMFFSKSGVNRVDGGQGWSVVTQSYVAALLFDEERLIGHSSKEKPDTSVWSNEPSEECASPSITQKKKRGHIRQTFDLSNNVRRHEKSESIDFSTLSGSMFSSDLVGFERTRNPRSPNRATQCAEADLPKSISRSKTTGDEASVGSTPKGARTQLQPDTKSDFQNQLRAAMSLDDGDDGFNAPATRGLSTPFATGASTSRRWMTMPSRSLATIKEVEGFSDEITREGAIGSMHSEKMDVKSSSGIQLPPPSGMQMRVPSVRKRDNGKPEDSNRLLGINSAPAAADRTVGHRVKPSTVPLTEADIMNAGSAFLDSISKSLDDVSERSRLFGIEESRVGSAHHLRASSRGTSIDWSVTSTSPLETSRPTQDFGVDEWSEATPISMGKGCVRLPNFAQRLTNAPEETRGEFRWWPYAYEVIINQWCALLITQRHSTEKSKQDELAKSQHLEPGYQHANDALAQAAERCSGVSIASAPMLFEIIKQSLGSRLLNLFRQAAASKTNRRTNPPLADLDETILSNLEHIITMVTDACLDVRNFDSWELRQISIDVNDSTIRFLCDLFSFIAPAAVHRLLVVYFSRFVTREGKQWHERDSMIGLRPSWETTKIRLNSITALVRCPDFVRMCGHNLSDWRIKAHAGALDARLIQYGSFRLPQLVGGEDISRQVLVEIPKELTPCWLSEFVVDVCLMGISHAEQQIQHRSSALLHEMFWLNSQNAFTAEHRAQVGAMFITFLEKLLPSLSYLSSFGSTSQLRLDLIPCALFVLQSAPPALLQALWRRLIARLPGKNRSYSCGLPNDGMPEYAYSGKTIEPEDCSVLDVFGLLNLALKTTEYGGHEDNVDLDASDMRTQVEHWRRDYLLSLESVRNSDGYRKGKATVDFRTADTSVSRRWTSHDSAVVVLNTTHAIVLEMYAILGSSDEGRSFLNPFIRSQPRVLESHTFMTILGGNVSWSHLDLVVFVRGATSVYLHALSLNESDIVIVKTLKVAAEILKIFGVRLFLEAVGETLQHWLRVMSFHCGARRAQVRVEATDLLELLLRCTWECFGSFFRIRVPLLAVQTEVMERIVATAAARFYREQRKLGMVDESFSSLSAEASLVPLWRTLDRIETQPASQNIAFRGALVRMAGKLKMLYRAYIAARVLSSMHNGGHVHAADNARPYEMAGHAQRISNLKVIKESGNYNRQFLGVQGTSQTSTHLAHYEAVEDAMINAADIFSATELPEHRVAWLRMLADFHATRRKFAEEASCHFQIHVTLRHAARLHGSLWSNSPFLPWTDNMPDPVYIDGDKESPNADFESDLESDSNEENAGRHTANTSSFRRIFYRVANSITTGLGEWETGLNRNPFYGTVSASEYNRVSPWITLREMEENMVEEAEAAGELFLQAGIIQSSRFSWNLATQYYAERFNYAKLALTYGNLAATVVTNIPPIDRNAPQEIAPALGRFYRVWFHGGAPDELSGIEFIYRTEASIRLEQFGDQLKDTIRAIVPEKTPIHLTLDDRIEEKVDDSNSNNLGFSRIGAVPLDPVRIKVTSLRPLTDTSGPSARGRPEWFRRYCDEYMSGRPHRPRIDMTQSNARASIKRHGSDADNSDPHHRNHTRSLSANGFSSSNNFQMSQQTRHRLLYIGDSDRVVSSDGELSGVDKFSFIQSKDRRSSKPWWANYSGSLAEKSLKVTQLQVAQAFPACVSRQIVVHRLVYSQCPLEAGADALCQWCAVLFRTAIATSGQAVVQQNFEPGIGTDAAKVVADCIHSSNVKAIGMALLKIDKDLSDSDVAGDRLNDYDRLSDEEIKKLRVVVARLIVVFIELLHVLITRNRDQLLDVIQTRKRGEADSHYPTASVGGRGSARSASNGGVSQDQRREPREPSPTSERSRIIARVTASSFGGRTQQHPFSSTTPETKVRLQGAPEITTGSSRGGVHNRGRSLGDVSGARAESAIAVQSELQRAFIALCKLLHPRVSEVLQEETPRWLRNCTQDNYFSLGTYRQTKVQIAEELCFTSNERLASPSTGLMLGPPDDVETSASPHDSAAGSVASVLTRGSYGREPYTL